MKSTLALILCAAAFAAAAVPLKSLGEKEYPRFIEFPDASGAMHLVDLEAEPDRNVLDEVTRNPANNAYLLFTRQNPTRSQTLEINNANSITSSFFNANRETVVVVHGWLGSEYVAINPTIRDAYLGRSDVNVIVLDWRRLAISDYITAAAGVPAVGRGLGQFLSYLNAITGAPFTSMHLVGFSLGAHLVGNAGRELRGQVARVTGLDPAGPLWQYSSNRLNPSDGVYVEAIHTDSGLLGLGIGTALGNTDFYPNGGEWQPGCYTNICNHNRAWELFAATVSYDHLEGRLCTSSLQITLNSCRGAILKMGNGDINKRGTGLYGLTTGRRYPY